MFIRRLPAFEYHAPASLKEALGLLSRYGEQAKVLAGGTDLLVSMKKRDELPKHLVNLKTVGGLDQIRYSEGDGLRIGALATIGDVERSPVVREKFPALWDAVRMMAAPQVRNLGTVGGNLCSAVPSADTAPPLIALDASVRVAGLRGEKIFPVEQFFRGPGESALRPDEILVEVFVPNPALRSGCAYFKLMRRNAMDLALVGAAAFLRMGRDGRVCEEARIGLGAVAPTPIRAVEAERLLPGKEIHEGIALAAGEAAASEARPIGDVRASEQYRREMVVVLTKKAVLEAARRAKE